MIDLHTHSTYSDGTDSPAAIVGKAAALNLQLLALTDHDTVAGNDELLAAGARLGVRTIAGVELSVENHGRLKDIDVLGYFPDPDRYRAAEPALREVCGKIAVARIERVRKIVDALIEHGVRISVEDLLPPGKPVEGVIGRKHIAIAVFARNRGRFQDQQQIFDELLGDGCPADVPIGFQLTLAGAAELIHRCAGIAILAHPGVSNGKPPDPAKGRDLMRAAFEVGFDGAEGHYTYDQNRPYGRNHAIDEAACRALCQDYIAFIRAQGKVYTAGSDYHGDNKAIALGSCGFDAGVWQGN